MIIGHSEVVSILLHGFPRLNVDQENNQGFSALMKAAIQGRIRCAKLLLMAGSATESLAKFAKDVLRVVPPPFRRLSCQARQRPRFVRAGMGRVRGPTTVRQNNRAVHAVVDGGFTDAAPVEHRRDGRDGPQVGPTPFLRRPQPSGRRRTLRPKRPITTVGQGTAQPPSLPQSLLTHQRVHTRLSYHAQPPPLPTRSTSPTSQGALPSWPGNWPPPPPDLRAVFISSLASFSLEDKRPSPIPRPQFTRIHQR